MTRNRHPKGAKIDLTPVGGRFAPAIRSVAKAELDDPTLAQMQETYHALVQDQADADMFEPTNDGEQMGLELYRSRAENREPVYERPTSGQDAVRAPVLDPGHVAQWANLQRTIPEDVRTFKGASAVMDEDDMTAEVVAQFYARSTQDYLDRLSSTPTSGALVSERWHIAGRASLSGKYGLDPLTAVRMDGRTWKGLTQFDKAVNEYGRTRKAETAFLAAQQELSSGRMSKSDSDALRSGGVTSLFFTDESGREVERSGMRPIEPSSSGSDDKVYETLSAAGLLNHGVRAEVVRALAWEQLAAVMERTGRVAEVKEGTMDAERAQWLNENFAAYPQHVMQGWSDVAEGVDSKYARAIKSISPNVTPQQAEESLEVFNALSSTPGRVTQMTKAMVERASMSTTRWHLLTKSLNSQASRPIVQVPEVDDSVIEATLRRRGRREAGRFEAQEQATVRQHPVKNPTW